MIARAIKPSEMTAAPPPPADPPAADNDQSTTRPRRRAKRIEAYDHEPDEQPGTGDDTGVSAPAEPDGDATGDGAAPGAGEPPATPVPAVGPGRRKRTPRQPAPEARRGHPYGHILGGWAD